MMKLQLDSVKKEQEQVVKEKTQNDAECKAEMDRLAYTDLCAYSKLRTE